MARPRPYLFCRYCLLQGEEPLNARGQLVALQELQGQPFPHGPTAEREGRHDTVIMRPRRFRLGDERVLTWSVGQLLDTRVGVQYDDEGDRIVSVPIDDRTIRYNDFVAVPRLGVLAIDDRTGGNHLGAKAAARRMQSAFKNLEEGVAEIMMTVSPADLDRALDQWDLLQVHFKVRPANPHAQDELSQQLSDAMASEGIGALRGTATPASAKEPMRIDEGPLAQAYTLAQDGYGQIGVRGVTPDGHVATIPRAEFKKERARNQRIQEKARGLRVHIETDGDTDDESFVAVAEALRDFYGRDD